MMTLEEAIKHCKDVALSCTNKECALEHFQLLKWLQEYSNMLEKQDKRDMILLDKVVKFLDEQLVNDLDEATGEPFINFQNYGTCKETFISYFKRKMLEKQGEQKETNVRIHEGDKDNPYDMSFEEAQNYITKRDFDICRTNDYAVFIDDRYILQTIGNILRWADDNPKQKLIYNTKSKFHEGDWVVQGRNILRIRYVGDEYYCCETVGGYVDSILISEIDSLYHLWTIKDAKDGDVLSDGQWIFQKMKEAGYEWDSDNLELKRIKQKIAWSEEGEKMINNTIDFMKHPDLIKATPTLAKNTIDWLKSLRPQAWKPSDTEINILQGVIDGSFKPENVKVTLTNILEKLKKLTK